MRLENIRMDGDDVGSFLKKNKDFVKYAPFA